MHAFLQNPFSSTWYFREYGFLSPLQFETPFTKVMADTGNISSAMSQKHFDKHTARSKINVLTAFFGTIVNTF